MAAKEYTGEEIQALRAEWQETFGDSIPYGFEVGDDQVPLLRRCIREKSQAPLDRYIESLPAGHRY